PDGLDGVAAGLLGLELSGRAVAGLDDPPVAQDHPGHVDLVDAVERVLPLEELGVTAQGEPAPVVGAVVAEMARGGDGGPQAAEGIQGLPHGQVHAGDQAAVEEDIGHTGTRVLSPGTSGRASSPRAIATAVRAAIAMGSRRGSPATGAAPSEREISV